jgi:hypothetical protein
MNPWQGSGTGQGAIVEFQRFCFGQGNGSKNRPLCGDARTPQPVGIKVMLHAARVSKRVLSDTLHKG